jgi:uncharacterized membrane protein YedE/YeeE
MDFTSIFETIGEPATIVLGAVLIGILFGIAARSSSFCLRSSVRNIIAPESDTNRWQSLIVWLLALGAAIATTQYAIYSELLVVEDVRQLTNARSLSGVLIGGALFGVGMSLTRGCVSRLTVLSAHGNLRAVFSLMVFAAVAFVTFDGALTPPRHSILGLWTLASLYGTKPPVSHELSPLAGIIVGGLIISAALVCGRLAHLTRATAIWGLVLGATIATGWWFTYTLADQVFEPIAVESISFTRPAIDLISFAAAGFSSSKLGFGIGLLSGVLTGSFIAAIATGALRFEWFDTISNTGRYAFGAALMGFGGVLAGGCSVGAGLSGGALFALTPLVALASMIGGSALTEFALAHFATREEYGQSKVMPAE